LEYKVENEAKNDNIGKSKVKEGNKRRC